MVTRYKLIPVLFFLSTIVLYIIYSPGLTSFNHFSRLADGFLKGRLSVTANAPYLEQVPIDASHFYVPYPPMPAILLTPARLFFGNLAPQDYLGYLLSALSVFLFIKIALLIKKDLTLAIWTGFLTSVGTIVWFLASVSSSWYLGQVSGYFFITLALYESLTKKRDFLIGLFIGAAYLSRIELMACLPFFLLLNIDKDWFKKFILVSLGVMPFILFNFYYNFARFGVIWDKAYTLIPGVSTEPWYEKGVLHYSYIPRHLRIIFGSLPEFKNIFPFFKPGLGGLAIWFTTPPFLYALFANIKDKAVKLSWLTIFLVSLIIFSHGTTGFAQFGYRFAVGFYPFLIYLTIKGVSKTKVRWHHWLLLSLGVLINLWGVLFINKLDWINW